jgi:predicted TIM-barrel fold metal-dependent hydrolase
MFSTGPHWLNIFSVQQGVDMQKLIIVSGDSHAVPPPEIWPQYIEAEYHEYLPAMHEDNERYTQLLGLFAKFSPGILEVIDTEGIWQAGGYLGCWDADRRVAEMDREGVAAELAYPGDPRALSPLSPQFRPLSQDVVAAGVRAYNRWAADTFGPASDRILCVGDPASQLDLDAILAELDWIAEHGFAGAYVPGYFHRADMPPIHDPFWDPFWARLTDLGLPAVIHAGYGQKQCEFLNGIEALRENMEAEGRNDLLAEIINNAERFFSKDLRPRRAMWQLMLGGVLDRHPDLKLVMAEVRGDWLPDTVRHLDTVFEQHRGDLPTTRKPSEIWRDQCLMSLSFVHKAEVAMRYELGVETVFFGRDYPHAEGTWPNTADWLSDAFAGVPEDELRLMLGENAIRVLDLDRERLAAIAERVGPTVDDITGRTPELDPRMVANWDARGGYLKPPERVDAAELDVLLGEDVELVSARR